MKWPNELRRTQSRKCMLSILEKSDKPLTAMEIHKEIEKLGEKVWLSTVYRILDLFEEHNMIVKNPITNNEGSVYVLNTHKHEHYAKCISCNNLFSIENCPLEEFKPKIKDEDFEITNHRVEIFGYCTSCKEDRSSFSSGSK